MERRMFLAALPVIAAALKVRITEAAPVQDLEFIRAYERAQQRRPRTLTGKARIAPAGEPGTPLTIAGQLFGRDGRSPASGITVFAYHTDAMGHYDVPSNGPHSWRLKGWALTDAAGRFEFETIRPAPYPGRQVAAHIHINLEGPRLKRQSAGILFEEDPLITREERAASLEAGHFGSILPVVVRNGVQHVDCRIRVSDENPF